MEQGQTMEIIVGGVALHEDLGMDIVDFSISPAVPKTHLIDIPFRDGSLDLAMSYGPTRYENRIIDVLAYANFDKFGLTKYQSEIENTFEAIRERPRAFRSIVMGDDVDIEEGNSYSWFGYPYLASIEASGDNYLEITLRFEVEPRKYLNGTGGGIL